MNATQLRNLRLARSAGWRKPSDLWDAANKGIVEIPQCPDGYRPTRRGRPNKRSAAARLREAAEKLNKERAAKK